MSEELDRQLLENVGTTFRAFREDAGLSQRDAAAKVGSTQANLSYLERGQKDVSILTLQKWARLYGFEIELQFVRIPDEFDNALAQAMAELAEEAERE